MEMQPNIKELDAVIAEIEEKPETFDQSVWGAADYIPEETDLVASCGTAFCVAGHIAARQKNTKIQWNKSEGFRRWYAEDVRVYPGNKHYQHFVEELGYEIQDYDKPYVQVRISDFAAQVLGLSHASSLLLFDARNTIETIKQMRDLIAYGFDNLYRRWHNLDNLDEVKYRESRISQFTNNS